MPNYEPESQPKGLSPAHLRSAYGPRSRSNRGFGRSRTPNARRNVLPSSTVITMPVEITPLLTSEAPVRRYSGKAVLAFPAGLLAVFLPAPFGMLLGVIAMLIAGAARRELKRDATLRGTIFSVLGVLLGAVALLVQTAPLLLAYLYLALSFVHF